MVRVWVCVCDFIVTHGPYLSALEIQHYKAIYRFTVFTFHLSLVTSKLVDTCDLGKM